MGLCKGGVVDLLRGRRWVMVVRGRVPIVVGGYVVVNGGVGVAEVVKRVQVR